MKKVAFITSEMTGVGGVATVVKRLANKLKEEYEIVFIGKNNNFSDEFKCIEYDNKTFMSKSEKLYSTFIRAINKYTNIMNKESKKQSLKKAYFSNNALTKLKEILENEKIDYCIATAGANSMLLGYVAKNVKTHCIGWQLNSYEAYFENKHKYMWHQNHIFKEAINNLDSYIVLNNDDKDKIYEKMNIEAKVIYNPTSYDVEKCSELKDKVFMAAGHLWEGKGFDLLIRSFAMFAERNSDWKLHIYGVGPDKNKLQDISERLQVADRVVFKGNTPDTREAFRQSAVFCLSSRWEGMPMIALESLEMGVPIIAYDITAVKPIIDDGENGIIIEKFDVKMFASAMETLAVNDDVRTKYGKKAKEKSKEFNIDSIVSKWKDEFSCVKEG